MTTLSTQFTAAIAALLIAVASIGAIVHVPQDKALAAGIPGTTLA